MKKFYEIAVKANFFKLLTYESLQELRPGQRVRVPLGKRKTTGIVLRELHPDSIPPEIEEIKQVLQIDENSPPLSQQRLSWLSWLSSYYHCPLGLVGDLSFFSAGFKKKKQEEEEEPRLLTEKEWQDLKNLPLTPDQKACIRQIATDRGFQVHLIHGVTGSGKTEIYKALSAMALRQNLQVLILLPEIFLTPQIISRFSDSFPEQIASIHSQVSYKQKRRDWRDLLSGKKNLLIGTRSALFCPLPRLGLIVIDEEHDSSFKQDQKFCYHARDSAISLAKELNIRLVLGSATPDFASYKKALNGHYKLYELKRRALKQALPKVTLVDLKQKPQAGQPFWMSDCLFEKINSCLQKGKQTALFLNRRGQATTLFCKACGQSQNCPNCDISLTLHDKGFMLCHYCSYLEKKAQLCPSCKRAELMEAGLGTQGLQKALQKLFPEVKILRADRDSISSKEEMESFIRIVEKNEAQIIIGTQMLSKGLNFPSIYLVGLVMADMDFHLPDFRAGERAFQTMLQMAGRAGRSGFGEVVIQSFKPNHFSITFAKRHDYKSFFYREIKSREKWSYPPFSRLCLFRIDSSKEEKGKSLSDKMALRARHLAQKGGGVHVLGPAPAPLVRINNRWRFQILIKAEDHLLLDDFLKEFVPGIKVARWTSVKLDRDPVAML